MARWLVIGALLVVFLLGALFIMRDDSISIEASIGTLNSKFITCLPPKLTQQQIGEVRGILDRFRDMSSRGKVEKSDEIEIKHD
ncbi:MAG: hypothetical protein ABIA59_09095, partial [Candidatus Latescibacterota bacterium]